MKNVFYILPLISILLFSCNTNKRAVVKKDGPLPVNINKHREHKFIHVDTVETIDDIDTAYAYEEERQEDSAKYIDFTNKLTRGFSVKEIKRNIDIIIIHSSHSLGVDTFSVDGVIDLYNKYRVGAHYIIDRDGKVYVLTEENNVAFHAGDSFLPADKSRRSLNKNSIGIEIINSTTSGPTELQYMALAKLTKDIQSRHPIKYIYGHSDIAPTRKTDPWCFDWEKYFNLIEFSNPSSDADVIESDMKAENDSKNIDDDDSLVRQEQ